VIKFRDRITCGKRSKEDDMRRFLSLLLTGALILMVASVSFASDAQTVNGWISDSKCGAKGANAGAEACTKKCIAAGASPVVVTDKDQKVLMVDNPDALKDHYGHHVAVTGHIDGDKIHVDSVKMI
jgi:putative cell wall-binding protein